MGAAILGRPTLKYKGVVISLASVGQRERISSVTYPMRNWLRKKFIDRYPVAAYEELPRRPESSHAMHAMRGQVLRSNTKI